MKEKPKNDLKDAKANKYLIILFAIIVAMVLVVYGISIIVGGGFHDFCEGAIIWVLVGIGICAYYAYYDQRNKDRKD